jgi:hypothetical protein
MKKALISHAAALMEGVASVILELIDSSTGQLLHSSAERFTSGCKRLKDESVVHWAVVHSLKSSLKPVLTNAATTPMGLGHGLRGPEQREVVHGWCLRDASGKHSSESSA